MIARTLLRESGATWEQRIFIGTQCRLDLSRVLNERTCELGSVLDGEVCTFSRKR